MEIFANIWFFIIILYQYYVKVGIIAKLTHNSSSVVEVRKNNL